MVHLSEISLLRSKKSRAELSKWKNQCVLFLGLILADIILQQTNPLRLSSTFLLHRLLRGQRSVVCPRCCLQASNNSSQPGARGQLSE